MDMKVFGTIALFAGLSGMAMNTAAHKNTHAASSMVTKGYDLHGIDISKYQKNINWSKVGTTADKKNNIQFVFIKATEGTTIRDPHFATNWSKANAKGLTTGAYLFFHPNNSGKNQANYFIKRVGLKKGNFAPVVDIETTDSVDVYILRSRLQTCLNTLEKRYGVKPIIYTYSSFYKTYLGSKFNKYPLWIAQYQSTAPNISRKWHIWQHTDRGRVNGISGSVDLNVINGDTSTLKSLIIK